MQRGYIYQKETKTGGIWMLRYRPAKGSLKKDGSSFDGVEQATVKLTDVDARFPRKRDVEEAKLADKFLVPANIASSNPSSTQRLSDFIELVYFVRVQKEDSTIFGYKGIFNKHLKDRLGDERIMDFTTGKGQQLMREIAAASPLLSKNSLKNIKNFLKGVFTFAKQESFFDGENPMNSVETPKGNPDHKIKNHAASLEEIVAILEGLKDQKLALPVVAVAAFTGMRRGEIAGLRWGDLEDKTLFVNRTVWGSKVKDRAKTAASMAPVPVLPMLADVLETHRNGHPNEGFIFQAPKLKRQQPLDLHNLENRVIRTTLKDAGIPWHGFHSFRRGIATNLHTLGMPGKDIQTVLRHSNLRTTMDIYTRPTVTPAVRQGMKKLNAAFKKMQAK
jgi:integrase